MKRFCDDGVRKHLNCYYQKTENLCDPESHGAMCLDATLKFTSDFSAKGLWIHINIYVNEDAASH